MSKKKTQFWYFTFLLIIFSLIYIFCIYVYTNNIKNSDRLIFNNHNQCNPINETYVQFTLTINDTVYPMHVSPHLNKSINFECLNRAEKHKIILFWNKFWAWKEFGVGKEEIFLKHKCPVTKCEITTDKSRVNQSDFVVVGDGEAMENPPSFRPKNQRWIFLLYESPYLANNDFSRYNGVFNLTATYLSDSDFLTTYEGSAQMTWEINRGYKIPYSNKTKLAAALISNCWSDNSRRMDFINQLRKYIVVDVYGACGNKKCPISPIKSLCKELIASEYKFYFAFENSLCDDYITEKFFAMLKYNIVPVVMGDMRNKYAEFVSFKDD
jgi:glycoprotein 3-alpha-L-fucosyltransferase